MIRHGWCLALALVGFGPAGASDFSGVVALASTGIDRPYRDAATDHALAPLVVGRWRNVFIEGNRVALGLHEADAWSLAALGQWRHHQYADAGDAPGLTERRRALELGALLHVPTGVATLQLTALRDVSGAHRGAEYALRAYREWTAGRFTVVPALALQHQDRRLAAYYFDAAATTNLAFELFATLDLNDAWLVAGSLQAWRHGDAIAASPWLGGRQTVGWSLGVGRRF